LSKLPPLTKKLSEAFGGHSITVELDDFFVHDRKLRYKELNYGKSLLKNMADEPNSILPTVVESYAPNSPNPPNNSN